jgi:CBS domain containing-hemolysin-like protein
MAMPLDTIALLVAAIVLVNAVFVAAEFALLGAPRTAIEHRASQGDRLAARILGVLGSARQQDRYIATSQLGITLASLGLGMFGEHELARWLEPHLDVPAWLHVITVHGVAAVAAVTALTFIHIVVGEMVPKSLALQRAEGLARLVYWPMQAALVLTYPLVTSLNVVGRGCLALLGVRRHHNTHEQFHTPEELRLIVEESERGGALRSEAGHLLKELFEFGDLTAGQVMVPRVRMVGLPIGASPLEIRRLLETHRHTRYPVFDGDLDHSVGMLHAKDLLKRLINGESIAASDVRPMPFVPETAALDDVVATMQRAHAHLALIIDEHGGTAGLISIEDLLEEVVGEIDEGIPEAPPLIPAPDGSVFAAGTLRLDELGQHFLIDLEHEDVDSVSGLVLARLGRPPVIGDTVEYGRLHLEVTAVAGRGVKEVRARLEPVSEAGDSGAD